VVKILTFGSIIRGIRNEKKLSLKEVAKNGGISHSYLSQIENGKRNTPKPDIIRKLAKGLNVSYLDLLEKAGLLDEETNETLKDVKEIMNNTQWREATFEELQEDIKKQTEITYQLDDLLTGHYIIKFNGQVLVNKDKQKVITLIETLLK
jgi:transcriptional regulator with XRE-family HTH domain